MEKNVCIVNFNTPELTHAAILSLWKHTPDASVTVFDNSTTTPVFKMNNVVVLDNTKGQIIDFDEFLSRFPYKIRTKNNWGSAKHCYTIQKLWSYFPDGFVLMDSDVLVKKDISCFFDPSVAYIGKIYSDPTRIDKAIPRLYPFLCWINVKMCSDIGVNYFDAYRNWKLHPAPDKLYDTGASFLEDCRKLALPNKIVNIDEYILHLGSASVRNKDNWRWWLEVNKNLYIDMEEKTEETVKTEEKTVKKEKKEVNADGKYLIVIPYWSGGAQGKEIEYSVAGWRRHFKEPYQIVIVGDYHPVVDTGDDITFIKCDRVPEQKPENYRPHIDFVKKFKAVRNKFPKSKGFIFVADDCYAVNNFDIYDVMVLKQNGDHLVVGNLSRAWEREKQKTIKLLKENGYPIRNFTTHLPTWIEWDKLEELWKRYDMENESYIFEDLYFNIYYPDRIPLQLHIDHDNFKCGVYRPNPRMNYIYDAFKKKIWIQNSVEGWIPALDKILSNYYGI